MMKTLDPKTLGELNYKNYPMERAKEGQPVFVKGKVAFARIARVLEGEALKLSVERSKSLYPQTKPHTTLQIQDPVILIQGDTPSYNELAIANRCYMSKTGKFAGKLMYTQDNLGDQLPVVMEKGEDGTYHQIFLEGEPAPGQDVIMAISVFKSPRYEKRGLGIAQLFFENPVEYYNASGISGSTLEALGITVSGPVRAVTGDEVLAAGIEVAEAEVESALEADVRTGTATTPDGYDLPVATGIPHMEAEVSGTPAPVATPAPATTPATGLTRDQEIAQLQAKLAAAKAEQAGGESAFDAPPPEPQGEGDPWMPEPGIPFPTN